MVGSADKPWNSATTLYLARRLQELAAGRQIAVLDVGCGDGLVLGQLLEYGYDLYGYDLMPYEDQYAGSRRQRLMPHFGDAYDSHVKVTESQREIPFDDDSFDVLYANQVFEHVRFLDQMLSECARVLRPGGTLLANFPLATYPIEGHLKVPFAHWLPPGPLRVRYLQLACQLGVLDRQEGRTARATAVAQDRYLREETFYRFVNEIKAVSTYYFATCEIETKAFVDAKIDLLRAGGGTWQKVAGLMGYLDGTGRLSDCVTYLHNAAFCMSGPRKEVGSAESPDR